MQTLHVMPDTQGNWCVVDEDMGVPFSTHASTSGAERAARLLAATAHAETILVHDRYHRMHELALELVAQAAPGRDAALDDVDRRAAEPLDEAGGHRRTLA
jgi:hypothetical protein